MEHMNMIKRRVRKRSTLTSGIDRLTVFSPLSYPISCTKRGKKESIMLNDLVIDGDHRKGAFRASININTKFTSVSKITRIFRLAHIQCKKENGEILGNTAMDPIYDRLNNICDGIFLGCKHKDKTLFIIMPHGCPLKAPREETILSSVRPRFFVTGDLGFYAIFTWKGEELATLVL